MISQLSAAVPQDFARTTLTSTNRLPCSDHTTIFNQRGRESHFLLKKLRKEACWEVVNCLSNDLAHGLNERSVCVIRCISFVHIVEAYNELQVSGVVVYERVLS